MGLSVLFCGGGTGGHVQPALAVAQELRRREPSARIHFVGGRRGIEGNLVPAAGFTISRLPAAGLRGLGPLGALRFAASFALAAVASAGIVLRRRPDVVLATGGYASAAPAAVSAWLGRPLWLQEQNSVPGSTNRALSRWAECAWVAFEAARPALARARRVELAPNPVRPALREARGQAPRSEDFGQFGLDPGLPTVLFVGGSRGAASLCDAVDRHGEALGASGWQALVQAGGERAPALAGSLRTKGVDRVHVVGYIEDMAAAYRLADLVVCRAGALTLAELACLGKPAILVPFPHATDDHQVKNAQAFVEAGAARLLRDDELGGDELVRWLEELRADEALRRRMAGAMAALGDGPDGATLIADAIVRRARGGAA